MPDTPAKRPLRVFLCHASGDKPAVRELYRRLQVDGFAPWLDEEDLLPGQDWQYEIPKAVRQSDVVIVCLSLKSSNKEGYVQKEIRFALDVADEKPEGTIFLVPLKLEECVVPDRLSRWQWVNLFNPNGYERLLRALRKRAADLNASGTAAVSTPPALEANGPSVSNVSGGVNLEANHIAVGRDVVGRDQIHQTTINAQNVTIIQSGSSVQEIKPTPPTAKQDESTPVIEIPDWLRRRRQPVDQSVPLGLDDNNNYRVIGGLGFVRVPAGKFIMGSNDHDGDEKPQHTVDLSYAYWIGRYPVTNEQFAKFVAAAKYEFDQGAWKQKATHPVVNVSWRDALDYCQWLNNLARGDLQGLTLRLPTEAEWEKAARGGLSPVGNESDQEGVHIYPWGSDFDRNKCNSHEGGIGTTTPSGAYSPYDNSPYGAADMAGNVWEWCHSLYRPYPYVASDGRENDIGNGARVLRGGAFDYDHDFVRCAYRFKHAPLSRNRNLGFRIVVAPSLS